MTIQQLWEEYRQEQPDGYSYSQFCYHFQVWRDGDEVSTAMVTTAATASRNQVTWRLYQPATRSMPASNQPASSLPSSPTCGSALSIRLSNRPRTGLSRSILPTVSRSPGRGAF